MCSVPEILVSQENLGDGRGKPKHLSGTLGGYADQPWDIKMCLFSGLLACSSAVLEYQESMLASYPGARVVPCDWHSLWAMFNSCLKGCIDTRG